MLAHPSKPPSATPPGPNVAPHVARAGVLLVSADAGLWTAFTAVPGGEAARQFDSLAELVEQWPRNRPAVVVIDTSDIADLSATLETLGAHGTGLVPIALVDESRRVAAAALERQRRLFDHLLLPLDAGTAKTVLEHAAEEAAARAALEAGTPATAPGAAAGASDAPGGTGEPETVIVMRPTRAAPNPPATPPAGRARRLPLWWLAVGALVLVAAAVAWWLLQGPEPAPVATPAASTIAKPRAPVAVASAALTRASVDEQVEATLDRARNALRERRYIDPADDNALTLYRAVLALQPDNGEARQGLERIAEILVARATAALAARDNAGALRALEAARVIAPGHPRLAALDAQVNARSAELSAGQVQAAIQAGAFARAGSLLAQAERSGAIPAADVTSLRQELARRTAAAQLTDLAHLVQTRISQGQLVEPAGDNAKAYLSTLQERGGPAVADEVERLTELYQKRAAGEARAAIASGAWSQADAWIAELRSTRGGVLLAQPLQRDLERRMADARTAEAPKPTVAPPTPEPVPAPAPATAAAPPAAPVITSPAHLAKPLKIEYPRAAAIKNATGSVTVEADVDGTGHVTAVRIIDASPKDLFETAARHAVERAVFVPATAADGSHPRMTVSMRVRFQLEDRT